MFLFLLFSQLVVELLRKVVQNDLMETAREMCRYLYTDEFAKGYLLFIKFKQKENFSFLKLTQLLFTALDSVFNDKANNSIKYTDNQIKRSTMTWLNFSGQRLKREKESAAKQSEKTGPNKQLQD